MILPIHIIIAISSLAWTAYTFFSPSKSKINISYVFLALVFISGFYLVWSKPVHMVQTCTEGLVFLGVTFAGIWAAKRKLTVQEKITI
jgi:hypothetical protein